MNVIKEMKRQRLLYTQWRLPHTSGNSNHRLCDYLWTFAYTEKGEKHWKAFFEVKKPYPTNLHTHISDWLDSSEKNCMESTNYLEPLPVINITVWNAFQWEVSNQNAIFVRNILRRSHGSDSNFISIVLKKVSNSIWKISALRNESAW